MAKYLALVTFIICSVLVSYGQQNVDKKVNPDNLPTIRENSRDMVMVRKGNTNNVQKMKQQRTMKNAQRLQMHKKATKMQKQKMNMNRQKTMQSRRMQQQKAMQRRNH